MKVGIINFHCAHNYGAMLQAYALQETVKKELNTQVEMIAFEPDVIMNGYKLWYAKKIFHPKAVIRTVLNYKNLKMKSDVFEKFRSQYFIETKQRYKQIQPHQLDSQNFDAFITGSDQVWNMDLNGGLTEYLLSFSTSSEQKRISYAASIGTQTISKQNVELMKPYISNFTAISVREKNAVKLVEENFGENAEHVLDPVFLLSKQEWQKIAKYPKETKQKYVLLYGLEENELFEKTFKFIKENTELEIINVSPMKKPSSYIDETLYNVGPSELLGLIEHAEVVFTNSFHGTCFSIIYGKKFFVIGHSSLNSRIESILSVTELQSHMIDKEINSLAEFTQLISVDSKKTNEILQTEIIKSKAFLVNALNG